MTVRRNIVFIGPVYPPGYIMDCISYIKTSMSLDDLVQESSDNIFVPFISGINIKNSNVSCTVTSRNPVTGDTFSRKISTTTREIGYTGTAQITYSSSERFNISPCCVIISADTRGANPRTLHVAGADTVNCSLSSGKLSINVLDYLPIKSVDTKDYAHQGNRGIKSINGVSTENGNIDIVGVGDVTVTVTGVGNNGN